MHGVISKYNSCYTKCHENVKSQYFQVKKIDIPCLPIIQATFPAHHTLYFIILRYFVTHINHGLSYYVLP